MGILNGPHDVGVDSGKTSRYEVINLVRIHKEGDQEGLETETK